MALPPALQQHRDNVIAAEVNNPTPNPLDSSAQAAQQPNTPAPQTAQTDQINNQAAPVNADAAAEAAANAPLHQDPELAGFFGEETSAAQAAPANNGQQFTQPQQPLPQSHTQNPAAQQHPTQQNTVPQGVDTDAMAVVRAQQQIIDMMQRNGTGATQANNPAAAPAAPTPFFNIEAADLTADEQQFIGQRAELFNKLVAQGIKQYVADPLNRLAQQQQEATQTATTSAANAEQRSFAMSLQARIPDINNVYRTPQFATFLDEYVPEAGATRRELLGSATKTYNVGLIEAHVSEFKRRTGQNGAQQPQQTAAQVPQAQRAMTAALAPAGMVQPQSNPTQAVPQQAQPRRVITPEKMQEAQQLMMRGKLSGDKFNKLVSAFKDQQQEQLQSMGYQGNA